MSSLGRSLFGTLADGPVQFWLDRGVQQSTTAEQLVRELEGRTFQIEPLGTPVGQQLTVHFSVADGALLFNRGASETEPDAVLKGTPLQLARMGIEDPEAVIRSGAVQISGDDEIASKFRALLDLVRPDWEEELSKFTGDVIAHEVGRGVRGALDWARSARRSVGRSLSEYMTEEARVVVSEPEIEEFCASVDELAQAVDRLEARVRHYTSTTSD